MVRQQSRRQVQSRTRDLQQQAHQQPRYHQHHRICNDNCPGVSDFPDLSSSMRGQSRSDDIEQSVGFVSTSIWYSCLFSILSSFLVVSGIYFSLTKFDARFLFISVSGFLMIAVVSCVDCMSNLVKSKKAQHKQPSRVISGDRNQIETSHARVTRQQPNRTVANILTNGTLNSSAILPSSASHSDRIERREDIINIDGQNTQTENVLGAIVDGDNQMIEIQTPDTALDIQSDTTSKTAQPPTQISSEQTRKNYAQSPVSAHRLHDSEIPQNQRLPDNETFVNTQPLEPTNTDNLIPPTSPNTEAHTTDNIEQDTVVSERPSGERILYPTRTRPTFSQPGETIDSRQDDSLQDSAASDLRDGPESQITQSRAVTNHLTPRRNGRIPNMRRTLVMGLSGEEEVIEINEEDLDEMSDLPPPYESIGSPGILGAPDAIVDNGMTPSTVMEDK